MSKYFTTKEVECRCGECKQIPGNNILIIADIVREMWAEKYPEEPGVDCVSGARCKNYNTYLIMSGVGAVKNSRHITGNALDLRPANGKLKEFREMIEAACESLGIWIEAKTKTPLWVHIQDIPYPSWKPGKARVYAA